MGTVIDLLNQKFGKLTVISRDETKIGGAAYWICKCDCGKEISVKGQVLREGKTDCGCVKKKKALDTISLIGQNFNRLTVLERDLSKETGRGHSAYWICQCECGNLTSVTTSDLKSGHIKSCGCLKSELITKKNTLDLTNNRYGKLVALKNTYHLNEHHSYIWQCICDCGNITYISAESLQSKKIHSCGCIARSLGEQKIESILIDNKIFYQKEYTFSDLKNSDTNRYYRYDFAILNNNKVIRLIEFDGEQHIKYRENHPYFDYDKIQKSYQIKNQYAISHNIPLIRIPYTELHNLSLELLLSNKYLINEVSI